MKADITSALEYGSVLEGQIDAYETQLEKIIVAINQGQKPQVSKSFNTIRDEIQKLKQLLKEFRNKAPD